MSDRFGQTNERADERMTQYLRPDHRSSKPPFVKRWRPFIQSRTQAWPYMLWSEGKKWIRKMKKVKSQSSSRRPWWMNNWCHRRLAWALTNAGNAGLVRHIRSLLSKWYDAMADKKNDSITSWQPKNRDDLSLGYRDFLRNLRVLNQSVALYRDIQATESQMWSLKDRYTAPTVFHLNNV